jgi:HSP20 family protein
MSLIKWESMKDIEELFDRYTRSLPWFGHKEAAWPGLGEWNPRVDISESDGCYRIRADVPGVEKGDLKVAVEDGVLTLQGERKQEKREDNDRFHRTERFYGSFSRSFTLPADAETAGLKASSADGQLTVTIPKKASTAAKESVQVPVE